MMNFLFVDEILELIPEKQVIGHKYVTPSDHYLSEGKDGKIALIPAIIGEALGQLCAWNMMKATDFTKRPVAGIANKVTLYGDAYLGDTIQLKCTINAISDEAVAYHSIATVNGRTVFTVENSLGPLLPMEQFIEPEVAKEQFNAIMQGDCIPSMDNMDEIAKHPKASLYPQTHYDHFLEWEKGKRVIAQKRINPSEAFFTDHFPRKPVLPLTILLIYKINLAKQFLSEYLGPEQFQQLSVVCVRKVKMSEFVRPGSLVTTTMVLKSSQPKHFVLQYRSEVSEKRVCVAEIEFFSPD